MHHVLFLSIFLIGCTLGDSRSRGSDEGQSGAAAGVTELPAWLKKPPYWLPTPPEWGPPPAHLYTSFYAPQTIPQVSHIVEALLLVFLLLLLSFL